jgi:hypothetical protein
MWCVVRVACGVGEIIHFHSLVDKNRSTFHIHPKLNDNYALKRSIIQSEFNFGWSYVLSHLTDVIFLAFDLRREDCKTQKTLLCPFSEILEGIFDSEIPWEVQNSKCRKMAGESSEE